MHGPFQENVRGHAAGGGNPPWVDPRPAGETQDFISDIPYSGLLAEIETFPMATVQNPWVNGIGFGGER